MGRNTEIRRKVINHALRSHYRLTEDLRFVTLTQIVLSAQLPISPERYMKTAQKQGGISQNKT